MFVCQWHLDIVYGKQSDAVRVMRGWGAEKFASSERFVADLQRLGKRFTFETARRGEHYDSMIKQGIPKAIKWMKIQPSEREVVRP